jgi:hypothetical protein
MNRIEYIENQIYGLRNQLQNHKLYQNLKTIDDIKIFMENMCLPFGTLCHF